MLRTLQAVERAATEAERNTLARWGSWGASGVAEVFDESRAEFEAERAELGELLDEAEYAAARRTVINAHYTDPAIAAEVWGALTGLGFAGGRVLEPGSGAGTFIGLAPEGAQMTGVELDPVTAAISRAIYPQATIRAESFADTRMPGGVFDAAVGGLGGCPYAPGAAGNVATEKVAAHLAARGFDTGLDMAVLRQAAAMAQDMRA